MEPKTRLRASGPCVINRLEQASARDRKAPSMFSRTFRLTIFQQFSGICTSLSRFSVRLLLRPLEQQLWSECSRFLTNCVIYYNACILSELLEYAEREKDFELADRIKQISPVSWKHVNFYGEYTFRDIGDVVDLEQLVNRLVALGQDSATKGGLIGRIPTSETQIDPSGF
jgi:Tn3 transposase DDE domain